tara:strand:+ start:1037 stop:1261 length:225 start_codon:yes stop_codon:yes gene_type:complete
MNLNQFKHHKIGNLGFSKTTILSSKTFDGVKSKVEIITNEEGEFIEIKLVVDNAVTLFIEHNDENNSIIFDRIN